VRTQDSAPNLAGPTAAVAVRATGGNTPRVPFRCDQGGKAEPSDEEEGTRDPPGAGRAMNVAARPSDPRTRAVPAFTGPCDKEIDIMIPLEASPVGNNILLIVGPLILVVAIITAVVLTTVIGRKRGRPARGIGDATHRGAVQGGVIQGDPGQRNRRDEAPRES
jgi:hypothetical protein